MEYNFKPDDEEFYDCCAKQDYCTTCPKRMGCRLRYDFYVSDEKFEHNLRYANSLVTSRQKTINASDVVGFNNWIREKRKCEMMKNPDFSYE